MDLEYLGWRGAIRAIRAIRRSVQITLDRPDKDDYIDNKYC